MSMTKPRPATESTRDSDSFSASHVDTQSADSSEPVYLSAGYVNDAGENTAPSATNMADRVQALRLNAEELPQRGGKSKKKLLLWAAVIGLLVVGVGAYRSKYAGLAKVVEVDAVTVTMKKPVEVVLDATGYIIAHSLVKVSPTIAGRIEEVFVVEGQKIKKGDLLARLDDDQYRADLDQFKATLALAEARLAELRSGAREEEINQSRASLEQAKSRRDLYKKDAERAAELWESRTIPKAEFDRTQAMLEESESQVKQLSFALDLIEKGARVEQVDASVAEVAKAQALVKRAAYFVEAAQVRSPIEGTVIELVGELGEYVMPGDFNAGYCTVADLANLEAEIDIPEQEVKSIWIGQPCVVTTEAYPGVKYQGRVEWLASTYNRNKGIRRAKIKIVAADDKLLPDLTCRVQIHKQEVAADAKDQMQIPSKAVIEDQKEMFVYVLEDTVSRRRKVKLGPNRGDMVEIESGLKEGEVVLLPSDEPLAEGQAVRPRVQSKATTAGV